MILEAALLSVEAFYGIEVINRKLRANTKNRRSLEELRDMMERRVASRISPIIDLRRSVIVLVCSILLTVVSSLRRRL